MVMIKRVLFVFLASIICAGIGCHMFEDADNVDGCPLNSGYPCPCDAVTNALCDDNSRCYSPTGDYRGMCSEPCVATSDCGNTAGYGLEGICGLTIDTQGEPNYCVLVCDDGQDIADCPPGQECKWQANLNYGVCLPLLENAK